MPLVPRLSAVTPEVREAAWSSAVSLNDNLDLAVAEAISAAAPAGETDFDVALFFVSSIYEASAYQYASIFAALQQAFPSIKHIVGATTGAVIGPLQRMHEPVEVEARSSISISLCRLDATIAASTIVMSPEQVSAFLRGGPSPLAAAPPAAQGSDGKVLLLLATDGVKGRLSELVGRLDEDGVSAFGCVASSVTSLHTPKVFASSVSLPSGAADASTIVATVPTGATGSGDMSPLHKSPLGLVGLYLQGDIAVQTVVARSCLPIGPAFRVTEADGKEIKMLVELEGRAGVGAGLTDSKTLAAEPPLVQLERTLGLLSVAQGDALKRELLVGLVPLPPGGAAGATAADGAGMDGALGAGAGAGASAGAGGVEAGREQPQPLPDGFYGQKPLAFDPFTGSITVPVLPKQSADGQPSRVAFQFAMRDTATARADLVRAAGLLGAAVRRGSGPGVGAAGAGVAGVGAVSGLEGAAGSVGSVPLACLMLGSMERGNKVSVVCIYIYACVYVA